MMFIFFLITIYCDPDSDKIGRLYSYKDKGYVAAGPDNYVIATNANYKTAIVFDLIATGKASYHIRESKGGQDRVLDYRYDENYDICLWPLHGKKNQQFQFLVTPENKMHLSTNDSEICLKTKEHKIVKGDCNKSEGKDYEFCWEPIEKPKSCKKNVNQKKSRKSYLFDDSFESSIYIDLNIK